MLKANIKESPYEKGGFRERYAMDHGAKEIKMCCGHRLWIFNYSLEDPYQDANGATYDCTDGRWIG